MNNTARPSRRHAARPPTHPGAILREEVLPALGLTQGQFAQLLDVSRLSVSDILHERRGVSADMVMRLGKLLGNGPGLWLRMQQARDAWEPTAPSRITRFTTPSPRLIPEGEKPDTFTRLALAPNKGRTVKGLC